MNMKKMENLFLTMEADVLDKMMAKVDRLIDSDREEEKDKIIASLKKYRQDAIDYNVRLEECRLEIKRLSTCMVKVDKSKKTGYALYEEIERIGLQLYGLRLRMTLDRQLSESCQMDHFEAYDFDHALDTLLDEICRKVKSLPREDKNEDYKSKTR